MFGVVTAVTFGADRALRMNLPLFFINYFGAVRAGASSLVRLCIHFL